MKLVLALCLLLGGCASMSAHDWADALGGSGQAVSKRAPKAPSIDPIGVSNIRPF